MRTFLLMVFPLWACFACTIDEDDDGVSDVEDCDDADASLGAVAEDADCDGAVTAEDCDDADASSMVMAEDGDCDGYTDAEEVHAGTDPFDADSVIYEGGWPYNMDKDAIVDPGWDSEPADGTTLPEFIAVDQYGDQVSLYDFAGRGRPVILDVGTKWCSPCQAIAAYLSTGDTTQLMEEYDQYWWEEEYEGLFELVQSGEISWVTILFSTSETSGPATEADAAEWHEAYENPMVPVLADTDLTLHDFLDIQSFPAISVVDEGMVFEVFDNSGPYGALRYLGELLAE